MPIKFRLGRFNGSFQLLPLHDITTSQQLRVVCAYTLRKYENFLLRGVHVFLTRSFACFSG
ncbi:hypothetical protein PINS_up004865 [Pythium insidiosum]|nr:hypothetical protein PINS_up004865 [Pythium insidiosum]